MTTGLTPEEQAFEDELKVQIRRVITEVYQERYAGTPGWRDICVEVPDEICEAILDQIACQMVLYELERPSNHGEFRVIVRRIVQKYLPGPTEK